MIAGQAVELFTTVPVQCVKLSNNLFSLVILWGTLVSREISQVQRHVPLE
jgi:hypothetical protein